MIPKIVRHFSRKKIDDAKLKRLWPSRLSDGALAKELGHHRSVLRRRAIKLGMPGSRRECWAIREDNKDDSSNGKGPALVRHARSDSLV